MGKYRFASEDANEQKGYQNQQKNTYDVHVLFVDTNQDLLEMFARCFLNDFLVTTTNDLSTALKAVALDNIDVVVADLGTVDIHYRSDDSFLPLISYLQKEKPNIPVIIHSILTSDSVSNQWLYHHAYLEKWTVAVSIIKEKILELLHII